MSGACCGVEWWWGGGCGYVGYQGWQEEGWDVEGEVCGEGIGC